MAEKMNQSPIGKGFISEMRLVLSQAFKPEKIVGDRDHED